MRYRRSRRSFRRRRGGRRSFSRGRRRSFSRRRRSSGRRMIVGQRF